MNKESPSGRTSTQLAQIIVVGPLHLAPPLNLKERRNASQFRRGLYTQLLSRPFRVCETWEAAQEVCRLLTAGVGRTPEE